MLHAPMRPVVVEALRGGRLPLWDPWEGAGQPLLASAFHVVLHPVSIATAVFSDSIDLLLVALVVAAALGTWTAARTLGASAAASAVAAFGYGLSGYLLGMTSNALYLAGAATLPWVAAGMRHAGASRSGWLAAAAAVAAAGLSGDPGALVAGGIIGLALAWERGGVAGLWRAGAGAVLGVAGAAIQLVPTWAYLGTTLRGTGLGGVKAEQWAFDVTRLHELISPGLFVGLPRSYRAPVFEAFGTAAESPFPWAPSVFLGAPLIVLAIAGARRSRAARVLAVLSLFFLWVSLGRQAGATQLLSNVPVWGALRFWEKMVAPLSLCIALAAAPGADGLGDQEAEPVVRWAVLASAAFLVLGVVALIAPSAPRTASELYRKRLGLGLCFAGVSLAILAIAIRLAAGSRAAMAAAIVFLQSTAAAPFALHYGVAQALRGRPPRLEAAAPGPRIITPLPFNFLVGSADGDAIDRGHALQYRNGWPATNVAARLDNAEAYTGFGSVRAGVVSGSGPMKWALLRRLGATHVVAPAPEDDDDRRTIQSAAGPGAQGPVIAEDGLQTWAIAHRPWASFAPAARAAEGVRAAARALGEELAAGRDSVVVEAPSAPPTSPGVVLSVNRRAERIEVEAESAGPALLVVNDAWAPGWTASIDGSPAEVLPADAMVRAVRWPAGRHHLVMGYEPPDVALGMAISGAAVVAALVGLLVQRRRRDGA
jgi:hypothetical protein